MDDDFEITENMAIGLGQLCETKSFENYDRLIGQKIKRAFLKQSNSQDPIIQAEERGKIDILYELHRNNKEFIDAYQRATSTKKSTTNK